MGTNHLLCPTLFLSHTSYSSLMPDIDIKAVKLARLTFSIYAEDSHVFNLPVYFLLGHRDTL